MKPRARHRLVPLFSCLVAAIFFSLGYIAQSRAADESAPIEQSMTPEEFQSAGLNKLSPAELANLNKWLRGYREKVVKKTAEREARTRMPLIVSRIDGVYDGVTPGEVIRLEDGTAWRLANKDEHYGGHADHPAVAVMKSLFGWKMRISRIAEFYVMPVKTQ